MREAVPETTAGKEDREAEETNDLQAAENTQSTRKRPLSLWEIEDFFKCPVAGMCLSASEQHRVLKKAGISCKRRTAFEVHEILVSSSDKRNPLSEKMDHLLHRKFAPEIARTSEMDEKTFLAAWETSFREGDYAGLFWAAAVRPDLSIPTKRRIFGSIHMAMHGNALEIEGMRRRKTLLEKHNRELMEKAGEAAAAARSLRKSMTENQRIHRTLSDRLNVLEKENRRLKTDLSNLKENPAAIALEQANDLLRENVKALTKQIVEKDALSGRLQEENNLLASEIQQQKDLSNHFQRETHELLNTLFTRNRCDASCPSFDLCKRRVLLVGGLTKMEALYRQMIVENGGIFEYHDGYMKNGLRALENRLKRADIVLCPVSCNSHAACSLVKSLGKKHKKSVCMLASPSLSSVAQALSGGNGGVYTSGN